MDAPARTRVALTILIAAAAAAGCLGPAGGGVAAVSPAGTTNTDAVAASPATTTPEPFPPPSGANATERNITVDIRWTADGYHGGPYAAWKSDCDPANPGPCGVYAHETMTPASTELFNGTFDDEGHITLGTREGATLWGTWTFTGTIAGCTGAGSVVFPFTAKADDEPITTSSGREFLHAHETLTTPTSWDGYAGFGGAWMDAELTIDPVTGAVSNGTLRGYLLCE